ncbi:beta-galactosidase [Brachybacterium sp. J153]|uniref:beta-galactosidase n=1 Tax=Brachybacterium sp. J153 TaxID=3116488 RepID=UPI002E7994FB|nr:beta-galactosidase [Brachybacterium sp. J153]MEE1617704.1 beta-galactosidase [Brachybacterium sp. J153]
MSDPLITLELGPGELRLDGVPAVLLCSSVFPFRLPATQWEDRLRLVRESGYRMIDLYVHWGFHEEEPGRIDLSSPERDLARFLELAAAQDLLVMARPGPYICSETDGGGLPWWLHGDSPHAPAALRTSDPDYLAAVDRWFAAVMPVLAAAQITRGGPVALVQIENELDFFDCPDPAEYMDHLARSARAAGIEVPIIACAGQGDLAGASGDADGVVPTVNLYPSDASTSFDTEARVYAERLAQRGLPLMVTETNRLHRTLRREILAGARLVAPYLQTSGFDHLVLPSAGNWGDPGNLMTHDYDFAGYLSPEGLRRAEYDEAIALTTTLAAWGERLAAATPIPLGEAPVEAADGGTLAGGALALAGGGHLVGAAALDDVALAVRLEPSAGAPVDAVIAPGACPFLAVDVPLQPWGAEGTLEVATGELVEVRPATDGADLVLVFAGGPTAQVRVRLGGGEGGGSTETLHLVGPGAARAGREGAGVRVEIRVPSAPVADPEPVRRRASAQITVLGADGLPTGEVVPHDEAGARRPLPGAEALGLADGRLQAEVELSAAAQELLLLGAADLVRCEVDGRDLGVSVAHGAPISHPLTPGLAQRARLTAEIWGRANFDDARRPALRLGAGRGLGTVLEVLGSEDASDLWEVREIPDRRGDGPLAAPPLRSLGGWSSARPGETTVYGRSLSLPGGDEIAVLRLHGLGHPLRVRIDGGEERLLVPEAPVLVLEGPGGSVDLEVLAPHVPGGLGDGAELLRARRPMVRELRTQREAELAAELTARVTDPGLSWGDLPLGELRVAVPTLVRLAEPAGGRSGALLDLAGQDVQVTVVCDGRRVSRHVLGAPAVSGGDPARSWIPAGWAGEGAGADLLLLVEPLAGAGGRFGPIRRAETTR